MAPICFLSGNLDSQRRWFSLPREHPKNPPSINRLFPLRGKPPCIDDALRFHYIALPSYVNLLESIYSSIRTSFPEMFQGTSAGFTARFLFR
jgi:hypothetical protein